MHISKIQPEDVIIDSDLLSFQLENENQMRTNGINRYNSDVQFHRSRGTESETEYGSSIISRMTMLVVEKLDELRAKDKAGRPGRRSSALKLLEGVESKDVAYLAMKSVVNSVSKVVTDKKVYEEIGSLIEDELLYRQIREHDEKMFESLMRAAKERFAYEYKRAMVLHIANRESVPLNRWSDEDKNHVGAYLVDCIIEATGIIELDVVTNWKNGEYTKDRYIKPSAKLLELIERAVTNGGLSSPMYEPMVVAPLEWSTPFNGGYISSKVKRVKLVKTRSKPFLEELRNHEMPIVYEAINAIQSTPFRVNGWMLGVIEHLREVNATWAGVPQSIPTEEPAYPEPREGESDEQHAERVKSWRKTVNGIKKDNRNLKSVRQSFNQAIVTARKFERFERIYFPVNMDFRGRVYCVPTFNYQGPDYMKSLISFAESKPLGSDGWKWLAIHIANLASDVSSELHGFKVDKKPFEDRVEWVLDNSDMICRWAEDPFENREWTLADKKSKFQLLAAAKEWAGYVAMGESYCCSIPIALDGSCSGIQHYSAALRDEQGGSMVNLVPSDAPADIYQVVADKVKAMAEADAEGDDEEAKSFAKMWLEWGIGRSLVKRNVMTFAYSARTYGFGQQLIEDHLGPQLAKVKKWKKEGEKLAESGHKCALNLANCQQCDYCKRKPKWPFGDDMVKASMYLAKHVWTAVTTTVVKAAEGMDWLRKVASIAASENLPLWWETPVGFPVMQAYRKDVSVKVRTSLAGGSKLSTHLSKETEEINSREQMNGFPPNAVHSLDSSHLMLAVVRAKQRGITNFALVHDSFATLAADTGGDEGFFMTIRDAMVEMYESCDVFANIREQIASQLPKDKAEQLPEVPAKGSLVLSDIVLSRYCFA